MANKLKMVDVNFSDEVLASIEHLIEEQIKWLEQSHRELHDTKLVKWRRTYLGVPAEATRNFPFPNAANTVVQVIGETVDTMTARVMGLIYATHPLWIYQSYLKAKEVEEQKQIEARRRALEDFMEVVGIEPDELNLQFHEALWFTDAAKLGTSFGKISVEEITEAVVVGYDEAKGPKFNDEVIRSGPRFTKLRHEDVMANPKANTLEDADFVTVRRALTRVEMEDRAHRGIYSSTAVDTALKSPDRSTVRDSVKTELADQGIATSAFPDTTAEWDVYECYFPFWHNNHKHRLIYSYHKKSKTVLRKVFNFLPKNELPIKRAKLGYRTDGLYGHGYAELLDTYQEELSTTHNQRLDNATVANVRALRVSPRARALDSNVELYPSALIVGEKDDIEAIQVGDVYPSTFKNEEMTLGLVARRAGITPAVSGGGSGGMQKRPAVYSSQGTLAVMQENNTVVGFATSEFRHAHVILGSALTAIYGMIGTGGKEKMFGVDSEVLKEAFEEFKENRLRIPIRASTGAMNREVEKATGMLIAGLLQKHYTSVSQVMQAIANPMTPPEVKDYLIKTVAAAEAIHKRVIKDFGYDQPDLYIPEAKPQQDKGPLPQGPPSPGGAPVAGANAAAPGGGGGSVPLPGMGGGMGGPAPVAGPGK